MTDADDRALFDLCARVARRPDRLIEPGRTLVGRGIAIAEHRHATWLQLEVALGCAGHWLVDGRRMRADGRASALAFAPGIAHGYGLEPASAGAEVLNFKLRVSRRWPAITRGIFAPALHGVIGIEPLATALRRMVRLSSAGAVTPALVAALIEVLCLWPRRDRVVVAVAEVDGIDARVERAMARIDAHLARPPELGELARHVGVSPRHLARRFAALTGASPRAWADARRVARARELLTQGRLNVTAAAEALGFASIHAFSRWFHRRVGRSPSAFRERPSGF